MTPKSLQSRLKIAKNAKFGSTDSAGYTDEDSNAVRIEHHGLGVRGDMNQESAMDIAKRVDSVLKNAEIKTNVQHMKAVYQKYREADKATALIEQALMEPEVV
ncbi:hypothetical protein KFU94_33140 [Chloroflexi bacterium TSY]|nr:hypothetical protein [Chloroflexi bacterium TSY]